jgi:phosphoglycolate phosphatase
MKKLIIFDLDGTLLDTIEDLANSVNHALATQLSHSSNKCFNFFIGNGLNKFLNELCPKPSQSGYYFNAKS